MLKRIPQKAVYGGVCAGLAYRFGQPTWFFRIPFGLLFFYSGIGLIPYLILYYMMDPVAIPTDYDARTEDLDEDFI